MLDEAVRHLAEFGGDLRALLGELLQPFGLGLAQRASGFLLLLLQLLDLGLEAAKLGVGSLQPALRLQIGKAGGMAEIEGLLADGGLLLLDRDLDAGAVQLGASRRQRAFR